VDELTAGAGGAQSAATIARIIAETRARLAELEPFLAEAELMHAVLAVLDGADAAAQPEATAPAHVPASKARILAIVAAEPGISVAEIAARHGMKRSVVASSVSRLKRAGEVVTHRGGVRLPPGPPNDPWPPGRPFDRSQIPR
jgi:hypothetical protein